MPGLQQQDCCGATFSYTIRGDYVVIRRDNFAKVVAIANDRYHRVRKIVEWFCKVLPLAKGTNLHELVDTTDPSAWWNSRYDDVHTY